MSQHDHKYSGTFKYKLRKKKVFVKWILAVQPIKEKEEQREETEKNNNNMNITIKKPNQKAAPYVFNFLFDTWYDCKKK